MTMDEIKTVTVRSLKETLGSFGFERADVAAGVDHDGDNALFVTAYFASTSQPAGERPLVHAMGSLRRHLLDSGEERFPYLRSDFPDEDILADDDAGRT